MSNDKIKIESFDDLLSFTSKQNKKETEKIQIEKLMRLAKLIPSLLDKIDNEQLALIVGYNISFIEDITIQEKVNEVLDNGISISVGKAEKLKNAYKDYKLTIDNIEDYLKDEEKPKRT